MRLRRYIIGITSLLGLACVDKEQKNIEKMNNHLHHFNYRAAFMSGYYEGEFLLSEVLSRGDFGLGTFNNLDGEMIVLDGQIYRAKTDGTSEKVTDLSEGTPSAIVTVFKTEQQIKFQNVSTDGLKKWIAENLNTEKKMYALKLSGIFTKVTARSQQKVTSRPFPPIEAIVDKMVYHELDEVSGTLVGFQLPPYLGLINYPGLHFHFVGDSRNPLLYGGCAPQYELREGTLHIMEITSFSVDIPKDETYETMEIIPEKVNTM